MSAIQPAIRSALQPAIRSAILSYGAVAWSPLTLFAASEVGVWYDPSDFSTMFQDSAGTTPVTAIGDPVGKILDKSGNGKHATQSTDASRPRLGRTPATGQRNLLLATDTMSTQNYTTTAVAHTLSFTGTGTVTLSGTSTAGPLVGTGVSDRVSLTFTPTAGTLTLTVSGSVTLAQLELGSTATAYQKVTAAYDVTEAGVEDRYCLCFDGTDDSLATAAIDFSATQLLSFFAGIRKIGSSAASGVLTELTASSANLGSFSIFAPNSGTESYLFIANGGAGTGYIATTYTAPITNVIACNYNLAANSNELKVIPRINGATPGTLTVAGGVPAGGAQTFANAAMYIGRRGGTTLPLNGRIYSLIVLGRTATALEIAAAESYAAGKSGVVLP